MKLFHLKRTPQEEMNLVEAWMLEIGLGLQEANLPTGPDFLLQVTDIVFEQKVEFDQLRQAAKDAAMVLRQ